ncbi:dUTP diphosphatase [Clostridium sp.]|jgi:dimeric dUTPase (all-alpha-NTP-PPase superfamily)|uniref:dUTP diphosphatase n=1 Tax=Clostridium sp. TaxID=1506 RepID=UPI003EE8887E
MNLQKLFQMQSTLDNRILTEHNLEGMNLLYKKILSLQVELGELANETRCFKFWSTKQPSSKDITLEEYVDCLHFILSIGIEKKFTDIILDDKQKTSELFQQFLDIYVNISDFIISSSLDNYLTIFKNFLCLGKNLGFSNDDIQNAYFYKNNINHERQDNGY